ncbi:hypothetical protein IMG5_177920 [Ichthyophthirius multifiliis]|uniref:Arp2/3 complex 41 kDa subunit n=1 Tax=Ichthyophthirius multifiliis TaxID=5932 RepID=G0R2G4_ICHMU|nr:hypothetical protein IMG5_177920 [Ichthyophthirius multifiliis]EGR28332.1 hypothetical protein IMG5_177920 [Ichthyophthirius multifiliis]|eukprot:XP_004027677.1 hypothetical protein IMG5_177920 [Ichthyophthirius multifiliis]
MQQQSPATDQIFKEEGIVCHAYSPDGQYCAVSLKKSNVIDIYRLSPSTYKNINSWQYETTLKEHKQTISDLSFSIQNKLLSVSHDKSVFVWKKNNQDWVKEAVDCQNSLAFLKCTWSKNGKKFAIGSGDHKVYIGLIKQ